MKFRTLKKARNYVRYVDCGEGDILVTGRYRGMVPSMYGDNHLFEVEGSERDTVLNSAGHLNWQLEDVEEGQLCRVIYLGTTVLETGPYSGKESHQFEVQVADEGLLTSEDSVDEEDDLEEDDLEEDDLEEDDLEEDEEDEEDEDLEEDEEDEDLEEDEEDEDLEEDEDFIPGSFLAPKKKATKKKATKKKATKKKATKKKATKKKAPKKKATKKKATKKKATKKTPSLSESLDLSSIGDM